MRGKTHRKKCSEVLSFDNLGRVTVCIFDTLQLGKDRLGQLQLDLLLVFTQSRKPESLERKRRRMDRLPLSVARCLKHGLHVGPRLIAEGDRVVFERILGELLARHGRPGVKGLHRGLWIFRLETRVFLILESSSRGRQLRPSSSSRIVTERHVVRMGRPKRLVSTIRSNGTSHDRSERRPWTAGKRCFKGGRSFGQRVHQLLHCERGQFTPGKVVGGNFPFGFVRLVRVHRVILVLLTAAIAARTLILLAGNLIGFLFFGELFGQQCLQSILTGVLLRLRLGETFARMMFIVHLKMHSVDARLVAGHLVYLVHNVREHLVQHHNGGLRFHHLLDAGIQPQPTQLGIGLSRLPSGFAYFSTTNLRWWRGQSVVDNNGLHVFIRLLWLCALLLSNYTKPLFDGSVWISPRVHCQSQKLN
uniref:Uncharacterized protein n=1 Tax=Cacopsylla melanoneura TaxID=428564 RepID=A0A8D8VM57_9HEMI